MARDVSIMAEATKSGRSADSSGLSTEKIVQTARHLMEDLGVEGITMRRVGDEMGVTAMALYRHVQDKQALVGLIADAVVGEVDYPDTSTGPWHERLREGLLTTHREIMRYPGLGLYIWGPRGFYPSGIEKRRTSLAMLLEAGFDENDALNAIYVLTAFQGGFFLMEKSGMANAGGTFGFGDPSQDASREGTKELESFTAGLDAIIYGLKARLAERQTP